jgi:hypothetical protein
MKRRNWNAQWEILLALEKRREALNLFFAGPASANLQADERMNMKLIRYSALVALMLGSSLLFAQSLGEVARQARKNKAETGTQSRHFDNDNLPTSDSLSVVGPAPTNTDGTSEPTAPPSASSAAAEKQKASDTWQKKMVDQKQKIDALNHEIDIDQREMRLRAAAQYTDPTVAARNVNWTKDDAKVRTDLDQKQKALADAQKEMDDMQDQGHKAGYAEPTADQGKSPDSKSQDGDKDQNR